MPIRDLIPWRREEQKLPIQREGEYVSPMITFQQEMNRLFDEFFRGWGLTPWQGLGEMEWTFSPQVDVVEDDKEIRVSAELPGMDADDVDISIAQGLLTISGEKREEKEDRGKNYYRMERSYGSFRRAIPLPVEVDENKAEAIFKKGVLTITLPKTAESQAKKRISIKKG